jgi:hypothetical protein
MTSTEEQEFIALWSQGMEIGRLELQALGYVKHGDVPRDGAEGRTP